MQPLMRTATGAPNGGVANPLEVALTNVGFLLNEIRKRGFPTLGG